MSTGKRVAIVTGAAGGIGKATVERLLRRDIHVAAVDLDEAGVQALTGCLGIAADVSTADGARRYARATLDHFGRIDYLFNNAGIEGHAAALEDTAPEQFQHVLDVNIGSVYFGLHEVLPVMYAQGRGAIVNTASQAGLQGVPRLSAYVASKHAVIGLTRTAAIEAGG